MEPADRTHAAGDGGGAESAASQLFDVGLDVAVAHLLRRGDSKTFEMVRGLVSTGQPYSFAFMRFKNNRSYNGRLLVSLELEEDVPKANVVLAYNMQFRITPAVEAFAEECRRALVNFPNKGK